MKTPKVYDQLLKDTIYITGAPRSGTSILGKAIATLNKVFYHFEPPTLYMLSSNYAINPESVDQLSTILKTYLCEDLLLERAQGRGVNMRPYDDSSIFNSIDWAELHLRWEKVPNRAAAINYCIENGAKLALKSPNTFDGLPLIRASVPKAKIITIKRNGYDVIRSIVAKKWLSDESLNTELWPYKEVQKNVNVPYWVPVDFQDGWETMSCLARSTLMWCVHAQLGLGYINDSDVKIVSYEKFTENPGLTMEQIADFTSTETTDYTKRCLKKVRKRRFDVSNSELLRAIKLENDSIAKLLEDVNIKWGYRA